MSGTDLPELSPPAFEAVKELVLQVADDELVLGHRLSEWLGLAPDLEPDVAMASIAQDEVAHAAAFYGLLESVGAGSRDFLAFLRGPGGMRNAILVELPNGPGTYLEQPRFDWAFAVARQYLYDLFEAVRLEALAACPLPRLAELARKVQVEERYHLLYGRTWFERLAGGHPEARQRLVGAVRHALGACGDLCSLGAAEPELLRSGILPVGSRELKRRWQARVGEALAAVGLERELESVLPEERKEADGRRGQHTSALAELWNTMTEVLRTDPQAVW